MKIGLFISPRHTVPPLEHTILAPWFVVADIANGLVARGHDVYLFAAKESKTQASLCHFDIDCTHGQKGQMPESLYMKLIEEKDRELFGKMVVMAKEDVLDILHIHQIDFLYDLVEKERKMKFVFTLHDPITEARARAIKSFQELGNCHFVSISNAQRGNFGLKFAATVYNGINFADFPYSEEMGDYFLITGRVVREKGFGTAIKAILGSGEKLVVGGVVAKDDIKGRLYWEKDIAPYIDGRTIRLVGIMPRMELLKLYKEAKAFLLPLEWEEPFGLVMVEAMACGTPVIAYARGSAPEIIIDGQSGFLVNFSDADKRGDFSIKKTGLEGIIEAINTIKEMPKEQYKRMRKAARERVEDYFSLEKMVDGYEEVYRKILAKG